MKKFLDTLTFVRLTLAGAILGIAAYKTALLILDSAPSQNGESIAMGVGAIGFAALVKLLHVV